MNQLENNQPGGDVYDELMESLAADVARNTIGGGSGGVQAEGEAEAGADPWGEHTMVDSLAALFHSIWSAWSEGFLLHCSSQEDGVFLVAPDQMETWRRQIETPYHKLLANEKELLRDAVARRFVKEGMSNSFPSG